MSDASDGTPAGVTPETPFGSPAGPAGEQAAPAGGDQPAAPPAAAEPTPGAEQGQPATPVDGGAAPPSAPLAAAAGQSETNVSVGQAAAPAPADGDGVDSEAGAAGHGAEPRGKRTDQGEATYLVAIAEALWEEMERDERVFMLGEDIGVYGGAFKVTEGFIERFGPQRVMDTPIAEDTIVGMAIGAAMEGFRPVAEFQYADFMSSGFDEITTTLGRYHYRTGVPLPVVLRGPSGGGVRASNFHSTNPEPWFAHAPGLKVICPAFPSDAKGLLKSAIRDDNPCVFLEHKWIYRRIKEKVSEDPDFTVPIGTAAVKREGTDLTIVTYGAMVHKALEAADDLARDGVSAEVVDLRTVYPLDEETVIESVAKTGRVLVLYESLRFLGIGAEVAAVIGERAFEHLDAPIVRLAPPDTPVPFSPTLEDAFLPQVQDIVKAATRLSAW